MSLKSTLVDIGIAIAIAGIAFGGGFVRGESAGLKSGNAQVLAAQKDTQTAQANTKSANDALTDIRNRLAAQKTDLLAAQQVAAAALAQRDATQTALAKATAQRIAADRKAAHESPDCSNLEHLPVCPVLAHRLFGDAQQAPAAAASTGHH